MKKYFLYALLILIAGTTFAARDFIFPQTWNYRITVEIETPEGIKAGSAVRQVQARRNVPIGDSGPILYKTVGEALIIDLGKQGLLLELPSYQTFLNAFPNKINQSIEYYGSLEIGQKVELDIRKHSFVNFQNANEPTSIRTVTYQGFEEKMGNGKKIKSIEIQITKDPVTWGQVRKHLKWFDTVKMGLGRWDPEYPDPAKYLTKSSLVKG